MASDSSAHTTPDLRPSPITDRHIGRPTRVAAVTTPAWMRRPAFAELKDGAEACVDGDYTTAATSITLGGELLTQATTKLNTVKPS